MMTPEETTEQPLWRKEADAHKRAMPLQRLLGNGMDYADAVELYRLADNGTPWHKAGEQLGQLSRQRGDETLADGHRSSAKTWYLNAAACYRVGQVPLPDGDEKRRLYTELITSYRAGIELMEPPGEHVGIPWKAGTLWGWLLRPASAIAPPTVVTFGGFDGWREEYHHGATYLLERGVAVLLVDGPGQGETRLFGGLHLDRDFVDAFRAVIDHVLAEPRLGEAIGLWGNSMGGYLAAAVTSADSRVGACCVNGGTVRPAEFPERFPRMATKAQQLLGLEDPAAAVAELSRLHLQPRDLSRIACPLLVLHGTPDQVFLVENARALFDGAASEDKTWREWSDGDHCLYNHSTEKHTLIGDWFADRLSRGTS